MLRTLVLSCLLAYLASPAAAQTATAATGGIDGTVTDNTAAVLPGATVTITSAALMGARSAVTNEKGEYRFVAVPPGEYRIVYELPGFATVVRDGIPVSAGFTATLNQQMQVATQEETITVIGAGPVVDVQATKITTTFVAAQMANLPTARDLAALMTSTPAVKSAYVDVGGSAALATNYYDAYGTRGQIRPMVEGIVATEGTGSTFYIDYGSFTEVAVATAAMSAETGMPGIFTQMVAKSGGNSYHGGIYVDYENKAFGSRNIDDEMIAKGLTGSPVLDVRDTNRVSKWRDFNADVGGFLMKDKWWWYGSYRNVINHIAKIQFPVKPHELKVVNRTAKMTYALNRNNKLIGFINHNNKILPNDFAAYRFSREVAINLTEMSSWDEVFPNGVWKGEYNSVLSDAAFFEVRAGDYFYNWNRKGKTPAEPRFEDIATNVVSGTAADIMLQRRRHQVIGSLSYFKQGLIGSHNFKFGGEYMYETYKNTEGELPGGVLHVLRNGAPLEVQLYEMPNISNGDLVSYSWYAQDTWRAAAKLTFNLGFRFDRYRNWLPEQVHNATRFNPETTVFPATTVAIFNTWGPRLGVSYDLSGQGRTVLKANFSKYVNNPGSELFNPNPAKWWKRYLWTDTNGNGVWDPGEQGSSVVASSGGITNEAIDANLKMGSTYEAAGWLEQELLANWGVRTGFVWRRRTDQSLTLDVNRPYSAYNLPVTIPDPGPDGIRGNADDGPPISGYDLDPSLLRVAPFNLRTYSSDSVNNGDYYSFEITGQRRMSRGWSLVTSFAQTWSHEALMATNPNTYIGASSDNRRDFWTWQAKIQSTVELPAGFRLTPHLRLYSGQPYGRQVVARFNYGSQTLQVEPVGARRTPNFYLVDIRSEKGIRFNGRRVAFFFDVYNVLNANPVVTLISTSGGSFERPTTITSPRIAKIGAKLEW